MSAPLDSKPLHTGRNPLEKLSFFIATLGGVGLIPRAPGTAGTLMSALLFHVWFPSSLVMSAAVFAIAFGIALWAIHHAMPRFGRHDPGQIVVDEFLGLYVTWWIVAPVSLLQQAACFGAFRLFDILKPPPIRQLDRHVQGAFGVIVDDLVAGAVAGGALILAANWIPELAGP